MPNNGIELQSRKKWSPSGTSRIYPVKDTLKRAEPIAKQIGVTRLADITHMDVLRIPNYSAVLPGTQDYIWVYSGKGPTKAHARASALMESIERYTSLPRGKINYITANFEKMANEYGRKYIIHPDDVLEPLRFPYRDDAILNFVEGVDLFTNEKVYVPAGIAQSRYEPQGSVVSPFQFSHTNGLASGNVIEEAICHALCEVIERDAVSLADLRSSAIPFHVLRSIIDAVRYNGFNVKSLQSDMYVDDPDIFPEVDVSVANSMYINFLLSRFKEENIPLLIKDITTDIGIPTFIATSVQWITHNYGYLAEGHGTHPDARIALVRAITEVSQTRAANIQGARDDLRKMNYEMGNTAETKAWQFMHSKKRKDFDSVKTCENSDILEDIHLILHNLKNAGLERTVAVNLTDREIRIPVVRVIVPGLETFKVTKGVIGERARRYFPRPKVNM
jgi:ribosomal protein S12 methylthiotransferase accessory factor